MASDTPESASHSPMSSTTAVIELWNSLISYRGPDDAMVAKVAEICYVINNLAAIAGCPGNMSVDTYRLEMIEEARTHEFSVP